jgi:hypothetical protein
MQSIAYPARRPAFRLPVDRANARKVVAVFQSLVLVFAVVTSYTSPQFLDPQHLWTSIWLSVLVMISQVIYRATGPRPINWLSIDLFVLSTIWLVHFYHQLNYLTGGVPPGKELWVKFLNMTESVCYATRFSLAGLTAFAIGFNLLAEKHPTTVKPAVINWPALRSWYRIGVAMLVAGIGVGGILLLTLGGNFLEGEYHGTSVFEHYGQGVLFALLRALMICGSALVTIAGYWLRPGWLPGLVGAGLMFFYIAVLVTAGDRDAAYNVFMIIAVGFTEFVRPMKFRWLVVFLVCASVALGVGLIARTSPRRDPISMAETVMKRSDEIRWDHGFQEAGASSVTLYAAAKIVPDVHDYFYGRLQLTRVAGIVPFGGALVGALAAGLIDPLERDSPTALTYYIIKEAPGYKKTGLGTTCVADIYMDFGVPGVAISHLLLGMLCKLMMQKSRASGSLLWMAAYVMAVPAIGYTARDCITACVLRYVWWQVAVIIVISFVCGLTTRIGATGRNVARSSPRPFGVPMRPAPTA